MNKKNILVVSNKLTGNNSLSEWTTVEHPFQVNIVDNDETAIEICHRNRFDMVVVDATDHEVDSKKLHAVLPILQEDITLIRYEGETAKELGENIKAVFDARKYKRIQRMLLLEPSVTAFSNLPSFSLN